MASLEVTWKKMGDEFTYDIWYSRAKEGPWLKHNITRITDDTDSYSSTVNTYILDDLDRGEKYFIKVTCSDKYYSWWYSYSGLASIDGGFGSVFDRPSPNGGNTKCFNINVTI